MRKKRGKSPTNRPDRTGGTSDARGPREGLRARPFAGLPALKKIAAQAAHVAPSPPPPPAPVESPEEAFFREMRGVRPLESRASRLPAARPLPPPQPVTNPDAEALAELCDLVRGTGHFDVTDTTEYVEGWAVGLDRRLVRNLRAGKFAVQADVDLHGLTREQARATVDSFLGAAHRQGLRCVLVVHGRGLNSPDQTPVLKHWLCNWLARGPWSRLVLAFTSARPCDGGAGALYVLLRRQRARKQPMRVYQGAKS